MVKSVKNKAIPAASLAEVPIRRKPKAALAAAEVPAAGGLAEDSAVIEPSITAPLPPPVAPAVSRDVPVSMPLPSFQPLPPPRPPIRPAAASRPAAQRPNDIVAYWDGRRAGRAMPVWADLDAEELGRNWPNCLLLTCVTGGAGGTTIAKASRVGPLPGDKDAPEYSPMITEWMLSLGRQVLRTGRPIQDTDDFPHGGAPNRCRIALMPLGDGPAQISHILCNLSRA